MKISFRQSGGYTGLALGYEVDTSALPADEGAMLKRLVDESGIEDLVQPDTSGARDLTLYQITIDNGDAARTLSYDDMSLPDRLAPLHRYLQTRARPRPLR
ncbi:MAG: protealysin inhibitor emfourin [Longimicrobiaceae bacterium]